MDEINSRHIKIITPWIIALLNICIIQLLPTVFFLRNGKVPKWQNGNEYRSIPVLPYLSKVFERLIYKQIVEFINLYNLLTDRSQHSCLIALTDVIEDIRNSLDDLGITFIVSLDHSKAFDTVHHSIECFKLSGMFNFSTIALRLMCIYLTGSWQYVCNKRIILNLFELQGVFRTASYCHHYCITFTLKIYQCSSNILEFGIFNFTLIAY